MGIITPGAFSLQYVLEVRDYHPAYSMTVAGLIYIRPQNEDLNAISLGSTNE